MRFRDAAPCADLSQVLSRDDVDAVAVALPVNLHFEAAKAVLASGKDVFVEKPLATTSEECGELLRMAKEGERLIMVGHVFRFNAAVEKKRSAR